MNEMLNLTEEKEMSLEEVQNTYYGGVEARFVRVDSLNVGPYQRGKSHKQYLLDDLVSAAIGLILVGRRVDGSLWIVDGVQRKARFEKGKIPWILAQIFPSKGEEHEALIFKIVNNFRASVSQGVLFKSAIIEGSQKHMEIAKSAADRGFEIAVTNKPGVNGNGQKGTKIIGCPKALLDIYDKFESIAALDFSLDMILAIWPNDSVALHKEIIGGLSYFWHKNQDVNRKKFIKAMKGESPEDMLKSVRGMHNGSTAFTRMAIHIKSIFVMKVK